MNGERVKRSSRTSGGCVMQLLVNTLIPIHSAGTASVKSGIGTTACKTVQNMQKVRKIIEKIYWALILLTFAIGMLIIANVSSNIVNYFWGPYAATAIYMSWVLIYAGFVPYLHYLQEKGELHK